MARLKTTTYHLRKTQPGKPLPSPVPREERCTCQAFRDDLELGSYRQVDFVFERTGMRPTRMVTFTAVTLGTGADEERIVRDCPHCGQSLGDGRSFDSFTPLPVRTSN